ncbi:MAG: patatin-like protein [Rhodospirillaceae bacterium]|nr:patatin-like protein [Rhodospirillaceae bacterium]
MKEKELRFALVCYGGVSLAVYMHGVTKEILKLVRASRDYHVYANTNDPDHGHGQPAPQRNDPADTEKAYFALLREIGRTIDLRIVVDIVAGASAGGINGIILARALAHDLNIDPLRDFWLKHSDVCELMPEHVKAGPWRKWYFRPFVWWFLWRYRKDFGGNKEMRRNVSMFLRSRWFKPPFDGANLTKVLFDGFSAMGDPMEFGSSLVPAGLSLDLFATITDFYGYITDTPIHDPPVVRDREHRQTLKFSYRHWPKGFEQSDFGRDNLGGLTFASRATSSFPGAFPPMQFKEIESLLDERKLGWGARPAFLYNNFRPYLLAGLNPAEAAFIDGSVLNNKPFAQAIAAIGGRPAYRHVDRRLLYVDPHPQGARNRNWGRVPGFFETIKGALSDIPRNEPVHDDLAWVNEYNNEVRRLQTIIDSARIHIRTITRTIAGEALDKPITGEQVGKFRDEANNVAREQTGFAYEGYLRLKLTAVLEDVAYLVAEICGFVRESKEAQRIFVLAQQWAAFAGATPPNDSLLNSFDAATGTLATWVRFLLRFDVRYRQRRVRFVIRAINQFYNRLSEPEFQDIKPERLDRIKAGLYDALGFLQPLSAKGIAGSEGKGTLSAATVAKIQDMVKSLDGVDERDPAWVKVHAKTMTEGLAALGDDMALESYNTRTDALIVALIDGKGGAPLPQSVRRELLEHYIGFAVWDVLTFSTTNWRDLNEFDEIRVDRLSPNDAQTLRKGEAAATLKGVQFYHFGAFFSLAYRQNDYLWGRLHAAERLMDIVLDAARVEGAAGNVDVLALKKMAFKLILDEESKHLHLCADLITQLRAELDKV